MSHRASVLADKLDSVNRDVVAYCESLSADDWQTVVPNEQRTVGVLFQHIAVAYTAEMALLRAIIAGQPLPAIYTDQRLLDEVNARDAVDLLPVTKPDVLRSLERHARRAGRFIRALSDDDLAASATVGIFGESVWTVETLIERIVVGHPQLHLASIRVTLEGG